MYISLLLDTEDIVAKEADDVAMWCADIMHEEKTPGTFCVVGENARLMRSRGRSDVIAALKRHDIGLHSDQHSVHPTISEYLADKGWEDGIAEVVRREGPGVRAIQDTFGRLPSTFAGPGATWGPQIHAGMKQLGVPSVMYAHTCVPAGFGVHRFAGTRSYPRRDFGDMADDLYRDTAQWRAFFDGILAKLEGFEKSGYEWAGVFMGHPTHILHSDFWDNPGLLNGQTLPREQWKHPTRISDAELKVALANYRTTARTLRQRFGERIKTISEMNALYDHAKVTAIDAAGAAKAGERIIADVELNVREWPILARDFDARRLVEVTRSQLHTLQAERLAA